jgi:hypothetical protein
MRRECSRTVMAGRFVTNVWVINQNGWQCSRNRRCADFSFILAVLPKYAATKRLCAQMNRRLFLRIVGCLHKRRGENVRDRKARAGPSSFHSLAVLRIRLGRKKDEYPADLEELPEGPSRIWIRASETPQLSRTPTARGPSSKVATRDWDQRMAPHARERTATQSSAV